MKLLVSALEPSSNIHLKELKKYLNKDIELIGVFDESLGNPLFSPKDFSVMGFVDVFKKIFFFYSALRKLSKLSLEADQILLMDSSSFNIPLAKRIKKLTPKKTIIYYILPQVWAWKKWRVKAIEKYCNKLGAILPFEVEFYHKNIIYVGHPLLDEIKYEKQSPNGEGIVFMPGSRKGEIKKIFPVFLEVSRYLKNKKKILVVPQSFKNLDLQKIYGEGLGEFEISFDSQESLFKAEFAFICSGTATLEAALIGVPFVLGYKANKLDFMLAKRFVKLSYIGLANIFYQALNHHSIYSDAKCLHKELLQEEFNAKNLLKEYSKCNKVEFFYESRKIKTYLKNGSAKNISQWINRIN